MTQIKQIVREFAEKALEGLTLEAARGQGRFLYQSTIGTHEFPVRLGSDERITEEEIDYINNRMRKIGLRCEVKHGYERDMVLATGIVSS